MKILISFGTLTGNTENVAKFLSQSYHLTNHKVNVIDQSDLPIADLSQYDLVILGASTWGDGEPNPITEDFLNRLSQDSIDLSNSKTKFAIYGLGDSSYEYFCTACDKLETALKSKGGEVLSPLLRIDAWEEDEVNQKSLSWIEGILANY